MAINRRSFLKGMAFSAAAASGGCASFCGKSARVVAPGQKVRLGIVGVGGKGTYDWTQLLAAGAEIVAFCDVDLLEIEGGLRKFQELGGDPSKIRYYTDWREMLEREERNIDAITISTPDHMHAAIAVAAMNLGLHCYVQKPLVRTIWEAKRFEEVARDNGVFTQVKGERPPVTLNWDAWLGCAAARPFVGDRPDSYVFNFRNRWAERIKGVYHRFNWRAFYDFGTGAFGDMACHTMNLPFRGAELGTVTKAECKMAIEQNDVTYPTRSIVEVTYAPRESRIRKGHTLPETKVVWYDGDQQPSAELMPQVVATLTKVPLTGCLLIGTKGIMCSTNDYGQEALIALNGEAKVRSTTKHPACKALGTYLPRRKEKGETGQYGEFLDAIKGESPVIAETHSRCYSDIEHSIPMLEGMLVGCIAQRVPGVLRWDSANQLFAGNREANKYVKPCIRSGWEF